MSDKPVTIYDIAQLVNASAATVSRVLSNSNYPVSSEMSKKIKEAAKQLNYTPNMLGRQLKKNNSMSIGVIIPSISNPFYADVVLGIEEIARQSGYQVLLCNAHQNPKLEAEYLQTLLEKQVKGVIISSISQRRGWLKPYLNRGVSIISIDQRIESRQVVQIGFDYRHGAYLACSHLIQRGHRRIAFISAALNRSSRQHIHQGYQDAMQEAGITPLKAWIQISEDCEDTKYCSTFEFNNGKQLAHHLIAMPIQERPTAILSCNDLTAAGAIKELKEQGIDVPGQMSVIGFDNIELSEMLTPSLTTVNLPKYELGTLACRTLMNLLNGDHVGEREMMLPPEVIERDSVVTRLE
ncbi:LacI family DNA-binding transcriptional regulator [Paenibacillus cremeus]|uniref:LacI family transcriptional regulator n=1 Tax=Paenibacillus cremeus TaxID=2163881 RepID=A0A559K9T7_9BACL|nr:LacI family DNA-binding transcriptional regulator [Paenibacillus cremeus]TVY08901.1 LacI family transcriptional regulator [Paenibacillus cremeus]